MTIHEFMVQFPDEKSCRDHFKKVREVNGITCKKCHSKEHYWLANKWQWQCIRCRFRTTLRSGTSMQWAKLSFHDWYLCLALMSATKKGVSCKEMQRQLGHKRYRTTWELMQKIRGSMAHRDCLKDIDDAVEFDIEAFGKESAKKQFDSAKLRSTYMESRCHEPWFNDQLSKLDDKKILSNKIRWIGDRHSMMPGFKLFFNTYMTLDIEVFKKSTGQNWANIIMGNARRTILGIHHKVSTKYLQYYLSEFCFKLNRRALNENRFDSMVWAVSRKFSGTLPTMQGNFEHSS